MKFYVSILLLGTLVGCALAATSCVGRCGENDGTTGCQCNSVCATYGDCCSDYEAVCLTCANRCGDPYVPSAECHCNNECSNFGNCCPDYSQLCDGGSGGTDPTPGTVTDQEIRDLSAELFTLDVNNLGSSIVVDLGGQTSQGSSSDLAPEPLFTSVPDLTADTYVQFETLRDNYNREEQFAEEVTAEELAENSAFLDAVTATQVMGRLEEFLITKQIITGTLKDSIDEIWFTNYKRGTEVSSSGFEHVFMGEIDGSSVGGFHSWVSYLREEEQGTANYKGYIEYGAFGSGNYILTSTFTWYDANKAIGGFFVGTSPELDLALFTLCFYTRPNQQCQVSLDGNLHYIQTWEEDYNGQTLVGSAYPIVG